jgi:hypothetical protein
MTLEHWDGMSEPDIAESAPKPMIVANNPNTCGYRLTKSGTVLISLRERKGPRLGQ